MKKLLLLILFILMPTISQAVGLTVEETNDLNFDLANIHYVAGTYEYKDGTKCRFLLTKTEWDSFYRGNGLGCPGSTGSSTGVQNGKTQNGKVQNGAVVNK